MYVRLLDRSASSNEADGKVSASTVAKYCVHACLEFCDQSLGHVCLYSSRKAAAVNAERTLTAKYLFRKAEGKGQPLLGDVLCGIYVLEIAEGGATGGEHAAEIFVKRYLKGVVISRVLCINSSRKSGSLLCHADVSPKK